MHMKFTLFVLPLFIALAASSTAPLVDTAIAACSPTDVINGTTAADATKAMERAGYRQVQVYQKGCDNSWHAHAVLNGNPLNVVWNGQGQVVTEGD